VYLLRIGSNDISGVDLLREDETLVATRFQRISGYESLAKLEHSETLKVGKDRKECLIDDCKAKGFLVIEVVVQGTFGDLSCRKNCMYAAHRILSGTSRESVGVQLDAADDLLTMKPPAVIGSLGPAKLPCVRASLAADSLHTSRAASLPPARRCGAEESSGIEGRVGESASELLCVGSASSLGKKAVM
jgi:hypothetical protein